MSWQNELLAYRQTRLPWVVFGPLALTLCLAAGNNWDPLPWMSVAFAWLLLLQFRLLDDLADRQRDSIDHPERVLVRARSVRAFWILWLLTTAGNALLAASKSPQLLLFYISVTCFLCAWYFLREHCGVPEGLHFHVVLTKYPAFVYLLHPSSHTGPSWVVLGGTYLVLCIYEGLHDRRRRTARGARLLLTLESAALGCLLIISLLGSWRVDT